MHNRQYELRYLPLFYYDLQDIIGYLTNHLQNPAAADALIDAVEEAILARSTCAEAFEPDGSAKTRPHPYYRIYVKNYTIYYVVIGNVMEVRRILYSKRNTSSLL